jgi:hypothetical protein
MSSFEFRVAELFPHQATRETGVRARCKAEDALQTGSTLVLDFTACNLSPSFADEFVGRLAQSLGAEGFRARVQIVGIGPTERQLLRHVVSRRLHDAAERKPSSH